MISLQGGSAWGLCVTEPIDIRYGVGLRKRVCIDGFCRSSMSGTQDSLCMVEFPRTPWSILQKNCNYQQDRDGLAALQEADRPFLKLTKGIFEPDEEERPCNG